MSTASTATNRQVRLKARPQGLPSDDVWEVTEEPVREPGPGEVHVRVDYLSLDPAMRGWMNDVRSYVPPVGLGEVMRAAGAGTVVASNDDRYRPGDTVTGTFGAQEHAVVPGNDVLPADTSLAPLPTWLGVLGMTGLTAYFGLLDVCEPKTGETVVVSGAAGAVGSVVGQIAKRKGCRAVGIAGGPEKCAWVVDELGFDGCVDYKAGDLRAGLREHAPKGVDAYFDNVGGETLNTVLPMMRRGGRIAICGAISQYNETAVAGPSNYLSLLVSRARMEGFLVFDYVARYPEALREMAGWLQEGTLIAREDVVDGGITAFGATLRKLFAGENTGKLVLKL